MLGVLVVCFLTMFFFLFSSIKIGHITAISLAFGFWQILSMFSRFPNIQWPSAVDNGFSVASITNLNTDFLSPECVIENLRFELKWAFSLALAPVLLLSFVVFYILGEIRSCIAFRVGKVVHFKYLAFSEDEPKQAKKNRLVKAWQNLLRSVKNGCVWGINFGIWFVQQGCTRQQMKTFANKIINSYCTFLSFSYSFIITAASEIFICSSQPNGLFTLNSSPDIVCYSDPRWYTMLPFSVLVFIVLNGCSIALFIYLFLKIDMITRRGSMYRHRYKFVLQRFVNKFFFWEAVVTLRKTFISLLNIFFKPMLVITLAVGCIFAGMILHMKYVPFKRKFHNVCNM